MRDDVLQIPDHLRDALWKVESARIEPDDRAGLIVCGMGGSASGGDLALGVLSDRLFRPMLTERSDRLPSWLTDEWAVLCSSYSGNTEETVACYEQALDLRVRRIIATTGGRIGEMGREAGDPVIGLPGILPQPRTAVAYTLVSALAAAASTGVAPRLVTEIEQAADALIARRDELVSVAADVAGDIGSRIPVIFGAGLTSPVAHRWKSQLNENAKVHAFSSCLPEAYHNELVAWGTQGASSDYCAILLSHRDQSDRERLRMEFLASMIIDSGGAAQIIEADGASRTECLVGAVMLGDLVSLDLAALRGADPEPIPPIDRLKERFA